MRLSGREEERERQQQQLQVKLQKVPLASRLEREGRLSNLFRYLALNASAYCHSTFEGKEERERQTQICSRFQVPRDLYIHIPACQDD